MTADNSDAQLSPAAQLSPEAFLEDQIIKWADEYSRRVMAGMHSDLIVAAESALVKWTTAEVVKGEIRCRPTIDHRDYVTALNTGLSRADKLRATAIA